MREFKWHIRGKPNDRTRLGSMNADQKLEALYQLVHALIIEVGDLGVKLSRFEEDLQHTADRISTLEVRATTRLN
jgi:hypothetical protein